MTGSKVALHLTSNGIGSTVEVDGERLRGVRSVALSAVAGERTTAVIGVGVLEVDAGVDDVDIVVSDATAQTLVRLGWMPPGASSTPATSLLDGATEPSAPNVQAATPGEFAARWNEADDEQRQGWLRSMRQESERATICRMQHDGPWVPAVRTADDEIRDGKHRVVAPRDPGRC